MKDVPQFPGYPVLEQAGEAAAAALSVYADVFLQKVAKVLGL